MNTHVFLVALLLVVAASARRPRWNELDGYTFQRYVQDFHKPWVVGTAEWKTRKALFEQRLKDVMMHNAKPGITYHRGVNHLTDRTESELSAMLPGVKPPPATHATKKHAKKFVSRRRLGDGEPQRRESVDYRSVLTGVKDQGFCGSCWSFATTETIEAHYALTTGGHAVLSTQQLVSCVPVRNVGGDLMHGCDGYFPQYAMEYIIGNGGQTQEFVYPYTSYFVGNGTNNTWTSCDNWRATSFPVAQLTGYVELPTNDQDAVLDTLEAQGPVTTVMYVPNNFLSYEGGVFDAPDCAQGTLFPSHVVQIVGFGHDYDLNVDYWLLRNSWSSVWGELGYFRLLRTAQPTCARMYWPVNHDTTWGNVTACGMCGILTETILPIVGEQP